MASRFLRALACTALMASPAMAASIVSNGSFESPTASGPFDTLPPPPLTDWVISSGTVDLIGSYWQAEDGNQSIDMNGNNPATIYQDLATTAGASYTLSFWMAGNPDGPPVIKSLQVWWNGNLIDTPTFDTTGKSRNAMGWVQLTYNNLLSTGSTTQLKFTSVASGDYYGAALDNVSVETATANGPGIVPVPAAAPAGLALLGALAWRRRQHAR